MIERYFHKRANGTRMSNVTASVYCGQRVTLVELKVCIFLKVVNIS